MNPRRGDSMVAGLVRLRTPGNATPQISHREPMTEMNIPLAGLQNIWYFVEVVPRGTVLRGTGKEKSYSFT